MASHPGGSSNHDLTNSSANKMGYSVRTDIYRYTEWVGFDRPSATADWSVVYGVELYNHSAAPVPVSFDMETENIAALPASQGLVKRKLTIKLKEAIASLTDCL